MMNILFLKGKFFFSVLDSDWAKCPLGSIISNAKLHQIPTFWLNNNKALHFSLRKGFLYAFSYPYSVR